MSSRYVSSSPCLIALGAPRAKKGHHGDRDVRTVPPLGDSHCQTGLDVPEEGLQQEQSNLPYYRKNATFIPLRVSPAIQDVSLKGDNFDPFFKAWVSSTDNEFCQSLVSTSS